MRKTLMLALMLPCAPAFAADYVQAPGSTLTFAGTYQGDVFTGRFPGFTTTFRFDPKQLATSKLQVVIPLATAATSNADYDGELRGASFFDDEMFESYTRQLDKVRAWLMR